jgi:hypothetical protein
MIKYIKHSETINNCLTTDVYGNKIHTASGDYVIIVENAVKGRYIPISLTNVNGEWIPSQMEFDFG